MASFLKCFQTKEKNENLLGGNSITKKKEVDVKILKLKADLISYSTEIEKFKPIKEIELNLLSKEKKENKRKKKRKKKE